MNLRNLFGVVIAVVMLAACSEKEVSTIEIVDDNLVIAESVNSPIIEGQFVVVLNESAVKSADNLSYEAKQKNVKEFAISILSKKSFEYELDKLYAESLQGFSVKMSKENAEELKNDKNVKYILPDRMYIMKKPSNPGNGGGDDPAPSQQVPYGIARVGFGDGTGKVAWILDSGIDSDHPDLNIDAARSADFTGSRKGWEDENGHGTHCAGTVAAIDNDFGVVGVAAGASVVAIRVLNRRGSGSYSGIIAGVDYVAANASAGDAANMSLGGGAYQAIDDAVLAASKKGIYFALAAGNESTHADYSSPARVNGNNIWTISAMDSNDEWAYFSNYGNPPVDYCEPGYGIYSTAKGGGYESMSGTSMAAPHMCGILLMTNGNPRTDGHVIGDPDGNADPIGVI